MCDGGKFFAGLCDLDAFDCTKLAFEAPNCDYDDLSDLVPFGEEPKLGDGKCESRVYNTPECLFENGDCKECNSEVFDYTLTGDGICHGGPHNTEVCNYDAGDCESFNRRWPRCHLNAKGKYPDKVEIVPIIGDGICNSGLYNNQQCGFEDGDCLLCNSIVPNITKVSIRIVWRLGRLHLYCSAHIQFSIVVCLRLVTAFAMVSNICQMYAGLMGAIALDAMLFVLKCK